MSPTGQPEGECRRARHGATPMRVPDRSTTAVVRGALAARRTDVPAAREWRGNGRKAH